MTLDQIIAELEKATGPSAAFDCRIFLALFDKQIMVDTGGYGKNTRPVRYKSARQIWTDAWPHWEDSCETKDLAAHLGCPSYTSSIDAALTLVPEGWTVARINQNDNYTWACELRKGHLTSFDKVVFGGKKHADPTPAIALVIAALRARKSHDS